MYEKIAEIIWELDWEHRDIATKIYRLLHPLTWKDDENNNSKR